MLQRRSTQCKAGAFSRRPLLGHELHLQLLEGAHWR
jgi:hypothetical protein